MNLRILLKLGGAALTEADGLNAATAKIQALREEGCDVILVHGGGPAINADLQAKGIEWTFVNGQRVTTPRMMKSIESTLGGQVNSALVRHFGAQGIAALGFSGTDSNMLQCVPSSPELGQVGKIVAVHADWLLDVLRLSTRPLPVIAPLGVGVGGECYNINADWSAAHLAVALKVDQLLFMTDQNGILDEEGTVIESVDIAGLNNLIEAKMVTGGMLTKVNAILYALNHGVSLVRVGRPQLAGTDCVVHTQVSPAATEPCHVAI